MTTNTVQHTGFDPQEHNINSFRVHIRGILESCLVFSDGDKSEIVINGASIAIFGAAPKGLLIGAEYIVYLDSGNVSFEMVSTPRRK